MTNANTNTVMVLSKTDFTNLIDLIKFEDAIPRCFSSRQLEAIGQSIDEKRVLILEQYCIDLEEFVIDEMTQTEPDVITMILYNFEADETKVIEMMMGR